jgi:hypothetical protein
MEADKQQKLLIKVEYSCGRIEAYDNMCLYINAISTKTVGIEPQKQNIIRLHIAPSGNEFLNVVGEAVLLIEEITELKSAINQMETIFKGWRQSENGNPEIIFISEDGLKIILHYDKSKPEIRVKIKDGGYYVLGGEVIKALNSINYILDKAINWLIVQ